MILKQLLYSLILTYINIKLNGVYELDCKLEVLSHEI